MTIATINPATGETVRVFEEISEQELERRLARAAAAQKAWGSLHLADRADRLRAAAAILDAERQPLAALMTLEMGKPIKAARDEAAKCATGLRYYADNAAAFLAPRRSPLSADEEAAITTQPLGVILAVMPWNFPFWQVFRFAAPALVAGNAAVLKHASNVPQCALAIESVFLRAGFPEGVFQTLLLPASRVERVIADGRIAAVALTGSETAGSQVASIAGKHLKKTVLELGGSDPFIILSSANIQATAIAAAKARTVNSGQSCIAAKRFIVVDSVAAEFEKAFVRAMAALRVGDPRSEASEIGPLATAQVLADVERQVNETVRLGARLATGGARLDSSGYYYPPTVLLDVDPAAPVCTEEVFGPVAPVLRVPNAAAALTLANNTRYGLGASVWTDNQSEIEMFTHGIESGMVFVNSIVQSDPRLPFGGVKRSGYGRELGETGIHEFVNIKTIRVREAPAAGS